MRGQAITYHPRRLILATGAHEAPVPVPGWTLPGVMTTGGLQTLVRTQRVSPGQRVLIAGNGPLNLQLACELLAGGVEPVAVLEAAPRPGTAAWRDLARMARSAPDLVRDGWRDAAPAEAGRACRCCGAPCSIGWRATTGSAAAIAGTAPLRCRYRRAEHGLPAGGRIWPARLGVPHRFVDRGAGMLATRDRCRGPHAGRRGVRRR